MTAVIVELLRSPSRCATASDSIGAVGRVSEESPSRKHLLVLQPVAGEVVFDLCTTHREKRKWCALNR
jgi:hypothetical protein